MISKVKITRHTSELQQEFKFRSATLLKRDSNTGLFLWLLRNFKDTYFEKHLRTAASENLSRAAILTSRRYFRSSSLSAFYEIGVLKTSVKLYAGASFQ